MSEQKAYTAYDPMQHTRPQGPPPYNASNLYPSTDYTVYQPPIVGQRTTITDYLTPEAGSRQDFFEGYTVQQPSSSYSAVPIQGGVRVEPAQPTPTTIYTRYVVQHQEPIYGPWLNALWFVLGGGFLFGLVYAVVGLTLCVTIIFLPFGLQLCKLAYLAAFPFGKEIVRQESTPNVWHLVGNILWLPAAIVLAIMHVLCAALYFTTIIGWPFCYFHLKLAKLSLWPFGSEVRACMSGYQAISTTNIV